MQGCKCERHMCMYRMITWSTGLGMCVCSRGGGGGFALQSDAAVTFAQHILLAVLHILHAVANTSNHTAACTNIDTYVTHSTLHRTARDTVIVGVCLSVAATGVGVHGGACAWSRQHSSSCGATILVSKRLSGRAKVMQVVCADCATQHLLR